MLAEGGNNMPNFGIGVAILDDDRVLLTQREDFKAWCLPGGVPDSGESLVQTAIREAREETGLDIHIQRLVGVYSIPRGPNGGSHDIIFAGKQVGGKIDPDPDEVVAAGWFGMDELPEPLLPWTQREVSDALLGVGGQAWRLEYTWPFPIDMPRKEIYRLRDASGLSRQDFYRKYFLREEVNAINEINPGLSGEDC
jgi:ADP-ribose pyrophosphatase YjhB (NUDIX family)